MDNNTTSGQSSQAPGADEVLDINALDDINDQATLDKLLAQGAEPVETKPDSKAQPGNSEARKTSESPNQDAKTSQNQLIFGKYKSIDDAEKAFKSMQTEAQRNALKLREIESKKQSEDFDSLDFEGQVKSLRSELAELRAFKQAIEDSYVDQYNKSQIDSDMRSIEDFGKANPYIADNQIAMEMWKAMATHPDYKEVVLEDLFEKRFKPLIEGYMGKKIRVKENRVMGKGGQQSDFTDVSGMSLEDFQKNEREIMRAAGIN